MFEIHDERIGRLKIFNVTEARANFADVLKEGDAKVVVTRHGRPTKILIRYDEYLQLLAASGKTSEAAEGDVSSTITGEVTVGSEEKPEKPVPPKWVQREADQIVSSLRGLLK